MPKYRIYYKESYEAPKGDFVEWDLPWLRLVFDQRFDFTPPGKSETGRYQVLNLKRDEKGDFFEVAPVEKKKKGAI